MASKIQIVHNLSPMARGYLEAVMAEAQTPAGNLPPYYPRPGNEFLVDDADMALFCSMATLLEVICDCATFIAECSMASLLEIDGREREAGIDFWWTRNGAGAGFWDGDWEQGDQLTALSHTFSERRSEFWHGLVRIDPA